MKFFSRVLVVAVGAGVGAILAEGIASFALGRSILRNEQRSWPAMRTHMLDEERVAAAALTQGPYAFDMDPWVSMRIKGGYTTRLVDADVHTDAYGQRVRVGPPPEPGAQRIVVLGDSVAFGLGLSEEDTIAHQLEAFLAPTMKEGAPRPVAVTVACPGWSFENERRYFLDHFDELAPDVVVYVPVLNDLDDSACVLETGHRYTDFDPAKGAGHAHCSVNTYVMLEQKRRERFPGEYPIARNVYALYTGITPESRRRYETVAERLTDLGARCASRGAKLGVLELDGQFYQRRVMQFMSARSSPVPWIAGLDKMTVEDQLEHDAHPNARFARAIARRVAQFILEKQWIRGAGARALAPEDERFAGRASTIPAERELAEERAEWDRRDAGYLGPRIDFTNGLGWHQIYGGVAPDGTIGEAAFCVLANPRATRLALALDPWPDRPALYPFRIRVAIQSRVVGEIDLPGAPGGRVERTLEIPRELQSEPYLEVELTASNWIMERSQGYSRLACCRLVSLAAQN